MKTKHIGLSIFFFCVLLLIKAERYASEMSDKDRSQLEERDWMGLLHGARFYVAGVGLLGLGMFAEDAIAARVKAKRQSKGVKSRSEVGFLEWSDGTLIENPSDIQFQEAALALSSRVEGLECWFAMGCGWTIRASKGGVAVLQNVSAGFGPWQLDGQRPDQISRLWQLLRAGRIAEIRDRPWKVVAE